MPKKKTAFLWITDPWDTLDHPKDTTLRLAEEALKLGYDNSWADVKTVRLADGQCWLDARAIEGIFPGRVEKSFRLSEPRAARPSQFTSIHYRVDPPVDLAYLHPLQLLVRDVPSRKRLPLRSSGKPEIVNPPPALFRLNEKFEAARLPGELMPASLVSSQWERLSAFGRREGTVVLKPLFQAQSKGVELLRFDGDEETERSRGLLSQATGLFQAPVLLQRYLPAILDGEQRLWFLDGKLLAAVRKVPKKGEFKIDMDQGGQVVETRLDSKEKRAARLIGRHLKRLGIRMAAVDLIEGLVTDFNFTSPGLIPQMEFVLGRNLAAEIVRALARPEP